MEETKEIDLEIKVIEQKKWSGLFKIIASGITGLSGLIMLYLYDPYISAGVALIVTAEIIDRD